MAKLSASLVLNKYILNLFGVADLEAISGDLKDAAIEGYDENNISYFYHNLIARLYSTSDLPKDLLLSYDQNIYAHSKEISEDRDEPIKWKYFQYMALLFTEIYLDKYFADKEGLKNDLNEFKEKNKSSNRNDFNGISDFRYDNENNDLNKVAYWNATGSGKTLLMHVNILQYKYYLKKYNLDKQLNRVILLTPNEGLSVQHLGEFKASGLEAELFSKTGGRLFSGQKIEIIDIHKLEETSGAKTVAVDSFEGNNLVLVDEGHRGSGGESWKDKRNRLCENGFSFEYSATFGQAVHALSGAKQKALSDEYSKATLFDYSYRYFYNDGYGKDYQILNLNEQWHEKGKEDRVITYLTASLLSFYEQLIVFKIHNKDIQPFLIDKPLAIFVGGKVTKSISKEIASDVVEVLKFFQDFIKNETSSVERIKRLLDGKDGLVNDKGFSIFKNSFKQIRALNRTSQEIYQDVLLEVFNSNIAGASLHIDNLKGQDGEIGLRIGTSDYFGVINVGDDKGLLKICAEYNLLTDERDFSTSLFHDINSKTSKVNILIGSKKFSEGWSSWRVSTMGLLNIGRGEGSEIIQLFGRGVRLKGYKFSLKRSGALDYSLRPDYIPKVLPLLETLNIFGLRADYMQQFKDYLEQEGLPTDNTDEHITIEILPTLSDLSEKKLKYLKVKDGANFKKDIIVEIDNSSGISLVNLNWYPRIQILNSAKTNEILKVTTYETGSLTDKHISFLDWDHIYFEIQKFKSERSWYNVNISKHSLKNILHASNWYQLYIPPQELEFSDYNKVRVWQELAISLLKSLIERVVNFHKNRYYSDKMETAILDSTNPNFEKEYHFYIEKSATVLIDKIKNLKQKLINNEVSGNFRIDNNFNALVENIHLYQPLIYLQRNQYKEVLAIKPVPLMKGEYDFINDLKSFHSSNSAFFEDKELFILRNTSRKGLGFFESNYFYPDFIMWINFNDKQYITFIDPKGLRQTQGLTDAKLQLHKKLKVEIAPKLNDTSILLNAFIISNTPLDEISHWKGQESIKDFNVNNVFFQKEQKEKYVELILEKILELM
jgi:hypothetical protein